METFMVLVVAITGLVFGSFAGATVWRVRARQLVEDKKIGESVDVEELRRLRPLTKASVSEDRSRCLECGHTLAWYDLVPLLSWLSTAGRCRYCKQSIGYFEPLIELGTAVLFVALYMTYLALGSDIVSPIAIIAWPLAVILLVMLFAYDLKWFLLPNLFMFPLIAISLVIATVTISTQADILLALANVAGALAILSGLYAVLYAISLKRNGEDKTWVGFGDVKLGIALGLLIGSWELAFLALFLANFIGVMLLLPSLVMKKISMTSRIPLGPLLIVGFFIALFLGGPIIDGYEAISLKLSDILVSLML